MLESAVVEDDRDPFHRLEYVRRHVCSPNVCTNRVVDERSEVLDCIERVSQSFRRCAESRHKIQSRDVRQIALGLYKRGDLRFGPCQVVERGGAHLELFFYCFQFSRSQVEDRQRLRDRAPLRLVSTRLPISQNQRERQCAPVWILGGQGAGVCVRQEPRPESRAGRGEIARFRYLGVVGHGPTTPTIEEDPRLGGPVGGGRPLDGDQPSRRRGEQR